MKDDNFSEPVRIGSVSAFWVQGERKKLVSGGLTVEKLIWKPDRREDGAWPWGLVRMRVNSGATEIMRAMPHVALELRWGAMSLRDNPFENTPLCRIGMHEITKVEFRGRSESRANQADRVDIVEFVVEATCDITWSWFEDDVTE